MDQKRIAIFVDGGNFHHLAIKKIRTAELDFDFEAFAAFLSEENVLADSWKRYYVGTVREKEGDRHSKDSMATQARFFAELKKYSWQLRTSKLKTRTESITVDGRMENHEQIQAIGITEIIYERKREKGIDVMIATDLIVGAVENTYDIAIVISSDADLIPAIDWVRGKGKKVQYVGFSIPDDQNPKNAVRPLSSMIHHTDTQRVLVESDLKQFVVKKQEGLFSGIVQDGETGQNA